mmetsp:Transcript_33836/g.88848  ORF Transcript_33836/g.88848 Transcript_33836/m.88848 type:complete len:486 (+) Transcript_33836:103-1560(+)
MHRPPKRRRVSGTPPAGYALTATHPYGAQPAGSGLGRAGCRTPGLGRLAVLPDALLLDILALLSTRELGRLARVSRALYVLAHDGELWRGIAVALWAAQQPAGSLHKGWFRGTWKDTVGGMIRRAAGASSPTPHSPLAIRDFFSDTIFSGWLCSSLAVPPEWTEVETVDREAGLSLADFRARYEVPNRPVVITDVVPTWPAFKRWDLEYLREVSKGAAFESGPVSLPFDEYWEYARSTTDESPLYVFDPRFGEKVPELAADYTTPEFFAEDLFSVLGEGRPNYRWLIIGAARSGSTFHVDPNGTSAWNATITGAKKWIMLPPGVPPPGVHPNEDGSEVTAPVSLAEWFVNFYPELSSHPVKAVEFVSRRGDLVFVPSGWWHCVLNLEDDADPGAPVVALTQNFVSSANLGPVCRFLREKRDQVSGMACGAAAETLYERFSAKLRTDRPELAEVLDAPAVSDQPAPAKPTLWDTMVGPAEQFTFSF